ncbi:unnamed protein product, partial [Sphacelaria rigidula]
MAERRSSWQHPYVSVLQLAGLGSNTSSKRDGSVGGACGGAMRSHVVGDVKEMMDKTIGKRCYRVSGAVSAANYLEVPREARTAPLNLLGRYVYVQ